MTIGWKPTCHEVTTVERAYWLSQNMCQFGKASGTSDLWKMRMHYTQINTVSPLTTDCLEGSCWGP